MDTDKEAHQMGNNILKYFVVTLIMCFSIWTCSNLKLNDKSKTASNKRMRVFFTPDTCVNGKFFLLNSLSTENILNNMEITYIKDSIEEPTKVTFMNINKTEYLYCYLEVGGFINSFSSFEICQIKRESISKVANLLPTSYFYLESGLKLGMPITDLINIKGPDYETYNDSVIIYKINDFANSSFLKSYNMPEYFLECSINQKVISKIKIGFTEP